MATTTPQLFAVTDQRYGYEFGCDGLVSVQKARDLLADCSADTIKRLCGEGKLRKGKMPGRRTKGICRRSIMEYIKTMEE